MVNEEKEKSVCAILVEVVNEICDKYCKYPLEYVQNGKDEEKLYDERCDKWSAQ